MTLRARPVTRGSGRSGWNSGDRRTFLLNLGFAIAIALSALILIGYVAWSWYDDHFGAAATVDGTVITNDQLRTRFAIESFRIDYTESRVRTLQAAGRISDATATSQIEFLEQRRSSLPALSIERLIDVALQSKLAAEAGLTVTEAEIDAGFREEATTEEARHAWVIEVQPEDDTGTGEPGDAEKAAAKAKAEKALADLKAGKSWDEIAKTVSTAASAAQNGDLGWMPKESGYDEAFMTAVFAAAQGEPTVVVEGADGIYRIGRVTEIAPESVDASFEARIIDEEIKLEDYREAVRGDLIRTKLSDKVVADMSKPSLQRQVAQIFIAEGTPMPDGVKVRHILVSPKDDPSGAGTLPDTDPAWAAAEAEAKAVYDELVKDPSRFDQRARALSDEGSAVTTGGKLPFFDPTSSIDPAFAEAIFKDGLEPGDLIPPFKSSFGWHVAQFMRPYGDGDQAWMETLRQQAVDGADFAQLARDQGEGEEAEHGGDIGWVAVGQLSEALQVPIFLARIGDMTEVVNVQGEGVYLFKVLAEEERAATAEQIAAFEESGFENWYAAKKAAADITRGGSADPANG
ncbi:MAG TPA: peptidylprolyl isomerase [Candidatus Sulfomarinibacteraceae bacterium]|nr:peptidylprolyl isomerase [Candidatus Sulfomarinibacteraceae bacterium]